MAAAFRRSHHKSRDGCVLCKQRRVKVRIARSHAHQQYSYDNSVTKGDPDAQLAEGENLIASIRTLARSTFHRQKVNQHLRTALISSTLSCSRTSIPRFARLSTQTLLLPCDGPSKCKDLLSPILWWSTLFLPSLRYILHDKVRLGVVFAKRELYNTILMPSIL